MNIYLIFEIPATLRHWYCVSPASFCWWKSHVERSTWVVLDLVCIFTVRLREARSQCQFLASCKWEISTPEYQKDENKGFLRQGRARLRAFLCCFTAENTQLSPSFYSKPCNWPSMELLVIFFSIFCRFTTFVKALRATKLAKELEDYASE